MSQKYDAPNGPPPSYPQQPAPAHYDAGPAYPQHTGSPAPGNMQPYYSPGPQGAPMNDYYGSPQPQYNHPGGGYYPPQQPGGYYPPQQGMYYQQGPPPGGYGNSRGRSSDGLMAGLCAGLCASLCCLDLCLFF